MTEAVITHGFIGVIHNEQIIVHEAAIQPTTANGCDVVEKRPDDTIVSVYSEGGP